MKNKKNKNYIEYENKIVEACIRLMSKDKLHYPTVADIIKEANVTRPTFYLHFTSIEEVYELIQNKITDKVIEIINSYDNDYLNHTLDILLKKSKHISDKLSLCKLIVKSTHISDFVYNTSKKCADILTKKIYVLNPKLSKSHVDKKLMWINFFQMLQVHLNSIVAVLKGDINLQLDELCYELAKNLTLINDTIRKNLGLNIEEHKYIKSSLNTQMKQ